MTKSDIKRKADFIKIKYQTSNPYIIADKMGVDVQIGDLGSHYGFYVYIKKSRCIFLNEKLDAHTMEFVMAHELAHSIMHPHHCGSFSKAFHKEMGPEIEKEANMFAVYLLFGDMNLLEYSDCDREELRQIFGYNDKITKIRWEIFD